MASQLNRNFYVLLLITFFLSLYAYKPVVIIHGLFDSPRDLEDLKGFIKKAHPGTDVYTIDIFDDWKSILPLWEQIDGFGKAIGEIINKTVDGIHLIGYSQGGLIARGVISKLDYHNIDTFISLSSPQMGQYGETDYLKRLFPQAVKGNLYKIFYSITGQYFSIANYWNDPHQHKRYLGYCKVLPMINNEIVTETSERIRTNFMKLKKLILIGGPDDGVITPWQSSFFGFYDENEAVVDMKKQMIYGNDLFGLKSLDKREAIKMYTFDSVEHTSWHGNYTVFEQAILPWLL